ncbi:hypothetical protein BH10ACI1_BH10ACI1_07120 [soil metagenome]
MLKFNPKRIFGLRGIEQPVGFLVKMGFNYPQASKFLNRDNPMIKLRHIERLCIALNCTPNDLFEWRKDTDTVLPETHSLNALDKGEKMSNLRQMVKDIPSDKLAEIERLMNELKNSK